MVWGNMAIYDTSIRRGIFWAFESVLELGKKKKRKKNLGFLISFFSPHDQAFTLPCCFTPWNFTIGMIESETLSGMRVYFFLPPYVFAV